MRISFLFIFFICFCHFFFFIFFLFFLFRDPRYVYICVLVCFDFKFHRAKKKRLLVDKSESEDYMNDIEEEFERNEEFEEFQYFKVLNDMSRGRFPNV